jgi:DNA-binding transcriptional MerR regulator
MRRRRLYSMGEIARHAGRSRQTLHAYALLGLICESERTPGGHRRFSAGVLRRLEAIEAMKEDLTLAQIRDRLVPSRGRGR